VVGDAIPGAATRQGFQAAVAHMRYFSSDVAQYSLREWLAA
jgi:hypothetical protein